MLIPVFTVFAPNLEGYTPALTGIALGSYGLSQGILQMPFGMLSDRYGRKVMITAGLLLFAAGSLLGAVTDSIYGMIAARILQGMGAIGSVLIALLADLTSEAQRTKAMAVIGLTIGMSFSLAMVVSPAIASVFGLSGIFYFTMVLALCGIILLHTIIPAPKHEWTDNEAQSSLLKVVLSNKVLQRLNAGIFFQHAILTSTFFVIPLLLQQELKQGNLGQQWYFYLPLMLVSFVLMIPFIFYAERKRRVRVVFLLSVFATSFSQLLLAFFHPHWLIFCCLMLTYFIAFNILEASLPSLISKRAPAHTKGTAMGAYSSCQFMGIFAGGLMAGLLFQYAGVSSIFLFNGLLALLWGLIAATMKHNQYLRHMDDVAA